MQKLTRAGAGAGADY